MSFRPLLPAPPGTYVMAASDAYFLPRVEPWEPGDPAWERWALQDIPANGVQPLWGPHLPHKEPKLHFAFQITMSLTTEESEHLLLGLPSGPPPWIFLSDLLCFPSVL